MLEAFYQTGWGAFGMVLFMLLPFLLVFLFIIFKKSFGSSEPSQTDKSTYARLEWMWIGLVVVVFVGVNVASIDFMPTVATANASVSGQDITDIEFTAESWSYEMPDQAIEVGQPIRFSGKSLDTMHGFAVYDPHGKVLFTMMLMPGMETPTSLIHTFTEPGTYTIRCLEYCGLMHHEMRDTFDVAARSS